MRFTFLLLLVAISCTLSSCEFSCHVGNKDETKEEVKSTPKKKEGAAIYNNIELTANIVKIEEAYLVFADGTRVPDDNHVKFDGPVKLLILVNNGWKEENDKVQLGVSEKIENDNGDVLLEKPDLFEKYLEGVSVTDAKIIGITATIKMSEEDPTKSIKVSFKVWDKKGEAAIEGHYQLYRQ